MSTRAPLPLWLLGAAWLCACKPTAAPAPAVEATDPPAPPTTFVEAQTRPEVGGVRPDSTAAPAQGLEFWAHPVQTPQDFVAELREGGLELLHEVEVHDARELVAALAPNTLIWLHPGRYLFSDSDDLAEINDRAAPPDWSGLSPHYDDNELHDLHDIAFVSVGPKPAVILQPDSYAPVLSLVHVQGVAFYNLALGHRPEPGWCQGDVLRAVECSDVLIAGTTLFGSGTEGLSLVTVDSLSLRDSVITDCSEQFSTISNSRDIRYERVDIVGNRGDLLRGFAIYHSTVTLADVDIRDNHPLGWTSPDSYGELFVIDGSFDWGSWFVSDPRLLQPDITRSRVELVSTSVEGQRYDQTL